MFFATIAICLLLCGALVSVLISDGPRRGAAACIATFIGSMCGTLVLLPRSLPFPDQLNLVTNIPHVIFSFGIDALSVFFLALIFIISGVMAVFGHGYLKAHRKLSSTAPFLPLLVASMAAVVISRDALSFLICWELMSLSSFFLVTSEHEKKDVQTAGWIYLVATHLATAFLMVFFIVISSDCGSMLFSDYAAAGPYASFIAGLLFIFALIGFGTKAGLFPLHVWLPHAHPAAPSHISAIMSGVMIKTGIYGLLRAMTFLGAPPIWWGYLLIGIGVLSSVIGILYALMQKDLKRALAYSSVENISIVTIGLGIGLLGVARNSDIVAVLGFAGALFHIVNHAIFKGLLFMSAGSVLGTAHTLAVDSLGGLLKKMPVTGSAFLVAALSICGLPPFNGFISEWFIYIGLFNGARSFNGASVLLSVAGILGLAFAGALAIACFTKLFGAVFLGEARSDTARDAKDPGPSMRYPMLIMAALCLLIGLFPAVLLPLILRAVMIVAPVDTSVLSPTLASLHRIAIISAAIMLSSLAMIGIRYLFFRKKDVSEGPTWDCGFAAPTARMQYTSSSFSEPVGAFFSALLRPRVVAEKLQGLFPRSFTYDERVDDASEKDIFAPLFGRVEALCMAIRKRKKSTIQSYLALIFITLMVLFVLEVWFGI